MSRACVVVLVLAGCGRVGFDNPPDGGGTSNDGGGNCVDIPGLVSYWPMDDEDIVGTQIIDRLGTHHGTITTPVGSPAVKGMGKFAQALDWQMTTQSHVQFPSLVFSTTPGDAITVSLWFHRDREFLSEVLVYAPETPRVDFWLQDNWTCFNTGGSDCWGVADADVYGHWVHAVLVFVNGIISDSKMYLDGSRVTESCVSLPSYSCDAPAVPAAPFDLGGGDSYPFHGRMDEVRLYNRELTPAEVAVLYDGGVCSQ